MLTATDFFCGAGGRAIETHSANHPGTEHLCASLQDVDMRYLPRTVEECPSITAKRQPRRYL